MLLRPAKRSYNETALVLWLERLVCGWEDGFSRESLEAGRGIYRRGEVREVSLFADEATVHAQWEGEGVHAVLEWRDGRLFWRTTLERPVLGDALAAAGLYEIEELLGDELADRVAEIKEIKGEEPGAEKTTAVDARATALLGETGADASPISISPRELVLVFSEQDGVVLCVPQWETRAVSSERLPAYGGGAVPGGVLLEEDRAALLRLATHARKSGFAFDATRAGWRLEGPAAVLRFVQKELALWKKRWRVEGAAALAPLGRELPPLEMEAVVEEVGVADDIEKTNAGQGGFRWRWRLRLGAEWLPEAVVRRLLTAQGGAVLVPGRGLARLDARQQATLAEWSQLEAVLPRYALLSLFNEERVRIAADAGLLAWRENLLREPEWLPEEASFLRPYQAKGVAWLEHMLKLGTHPLLADEMGLGKTVQVLALLHRQPITASVLIVCPASVVPVWQAEVARFFPATPVRVLGRKNNWNLDTTPGLWLASYTQLRRNQALLATVEFSHAVLDEAQYIKNPTTKVAEACLAINARHRLALTGTPVENHPRDIWTIFRFLMPGLLGKKSAFEARLENDPEAVARLARQVRPFVLRRTKQAVAAELPAKVAVPLVCPMTEAQREVYRRLVEEGVSALGNASPAALFSGQGMGFLALLTRLRQAACDPGLLPGHETTPVSSSGKITLLLERLEEILENGHKVVVFSQFVSLLDRVEGALRKHFPAVPLFRLTGATTDRATPVASFQESAGAGVMLVSLRAGGTGITLHRAEYVFLLDPWWNPAVEAQAIDRVHRIGQRNTTFVYRMITADTVEARVEALKRAKAELFAHVVGDLPDMSDWSAHFPSLRALVG